MYQSVNDANQRLKNCMIVYEGRALYVKDCPLRDVADCLDILNDVNTSVPICLSSIRPPRLGYVETPDGVTYVSRKPARRIRQGVSQDTITFGGRREIRIGSKAFATMLLGQYVTFEQAIKNNKPTAFDYDWAVCSKRKTLLYKGVRVGSIGADNKELLLLDEYSYLKESLDESVSRTVKKA